MDIHFCVIGGRAIFLDLRRNRYFALPSRTNGAFVTIAGERSLGAITTSVFDQIAVGAMPSGLGFAGSHTMNSSKIATPESDRLAAQDQAATSPALVLLAWSAVAVAKILVQLCPLYRILSGLEKSRAKTVRHKDFANMDRIGAAFRKVHPFLRSDGNCLPLTLAFVWLCRRFGHSPALIIGVRVNPFSAHCWSQDGAIVLNDAYERVQPYLPILVS